MNPHEPSPCRVGVVGATGYTGRELLTVLARHPGVSIRFATSRSAAGAPSGVAGLSLTDPDDAPVDDVEVLFLCLPHGEAVTWVDRLREGPARIIDLTADHRPGSGREEGVIYGLPEVSRGAVASARVVANPGCYPTGVILALRPLREAGLVDTDRAVVVQAASGVTGAGRTPRTHLLFAEVHGDFRAYGLGNGHRHLQEMRALLPGLPLLFTPHLLPVPRGILETMALPVQPGVDADACREAWAGAYPDPGAVRIVSPGAPALSDVVGTDLLLLSAHDNEGLETPVITVVAALDNLGKGAAGQAVQNMNLMLELEPLKGIRCGGP